MIYGIDLGTRSIAVVGLPHEEEEGHIFRFTEVGKSTRGKEVYELWRRMSQDMGLGFNDVIFIEEPPYVNNRRTFGQLSMTCGAMLAVTPLSYVVPVDEWKKNTVGKGGVGKPEVAKWLELAHPDLFARCSSNQNLVDAACIALYGQYLTGVGTRAS